METGPAPGSWTRYAVRWRPIGSWGQGGDWAYRSPHLVNLWAAGLFALLATSGTLDWWGSRNDSTDWTPWTLLDVVLYWMLVVVVLCLWRTYVEVDSRGITVVSILRVNRVRWDEIDLVQVDGRLAITLLTRDRRITCWALRQSLGDLLPWSRMGRRQVLQANAEWIRAMAWLTAVRPEPRVDGRSD